MNDINEENLKELLSLKGDLEDLKSRVIALEKARIRYEAEHQ